jgi:hypothetical protein
MARAEEGPVSPAIGGSFAGPTLRSPKKMRLVLGVLEFEDTPLRLEMCAVGSNLRTSAASERAA